MTTCFSRVLKRDLGDPLTIARMRQPNISVIFSSRLIHLNYDATVTSASSLNLTFGRTNCSR